MSSGLPVNALRAAGFIIYRFNLKIEYLLMQTSYGNHHWTPPKGFVDKGESEFATALRETQEESGLKEGDLTIFKDFCKTLKYEVKGKPKVVTYWLAELVNKDKPIVMSEEHQAFKWLPLEEACELSGFQDFANILREAQKFIGEQKNVSAQLSL